MVQPNDFDRCLTVGLEGCRFNGITSTLDLGGCQLNGIPGTTYLEGCQMNGIASEIGTDNILQ